MQVMMLIVVGILSVPTVIWAAMGFDEGYERDYNIYAPTSRYEPDNPLNPVNKYDLNNVFNPVNRYHPDNPLNPINKYDPGVPFAPLEKGSRRTQPW